MHRAGVYSVYSTVLVSFADTHEKRRGRFAARRLKTGKSSYRSFSLSRVICNAAKSVKPTRAPVANAAHNQKAIIAILLGCWSLDCIAKHRNTTLGATAIQKSDKGASPCRSDTSDTGGLDVTFTIRAWIGSVSKPY